MTSRTVSIGYPKTPSMGNYMIPASAPPTGLVGREQALQGALTASLGLLRGGGGSSGGGSTGVNFGEINKNRNLAMDQVRGGIKDLQPWMQPGFDANNLQAALSGAMGPDAQAQAYANFQESPGQAWLREQGERSLTRNAAALGGLGGGNVMKELTRYGQGLASQDFNNYFNRLGGIADRGMQASALGANLRGQGVGAATAAGGQSANLRGAGIAADASRHSANVAASTARARDAAQIASTLGILAAQGRTDAGNAIAGNFSNNASALASLINSQGIGMSDIYGTGMGNLSNLLTGMGRDQSTSSSNLAQLIANIRQGSSGQVAGLPGLPGTQYNPGILQGIGNALGGAGTFIGAF